MKDNIRDFCPDAALCGNSDAVHKWEMGNAPFTYWCQWCGVQMTPGASSTLSCEDVLERPSWEDVWMNVVHSIAERSYDNALKVGAIVVSDDSTQLIALGYNGSYRGGPHVKDSEEPGKSGFIHAEVNCLVKCDFNFPKKKHMYLTHSPCLQCAKLIINAGISRVLYATQYRDRSGIDLLKSVGIDVVHHPHHT